MFDLIYQLGVSGRTAQRDDDNEIQKLKMNINWLSGGPYFEVSILTSNRQSRECFINSYIQKLKSLQSKVEFVETQLDIEEKIKTFIECNSDNIDLNIWAAIAGKRRARFFVSVLSDEIILVDFWFLGDEFSKQPITKKDFPKFKRFLEEILCVFDGFVGTLGWESDCSCLFKTENTYPHKDYSVKNLQLNEKEPTGIECLLVKTERIG